MARIGVVLTAVLAAWPAGARAQLDVVRVSTGPSHTHTSGPSSLGVDAWLTSDGSRVIFGTDRKLIPDDPDATFDWYVRSGEALQAWHPPELGGPQQLKAMTADASTAVFGGYQPWASDDTNQWADVYLLRNGQVRRLTPNDGGGEAVGMSSDGTRVVLFAPARLTADDQNLGEDLYVWEAGGYTRISLSPADATGGKLVDFVAQSDDARTIVFRALTQLTSDDTDQERDLFVWRDGQTTKLEPGNAASEPHFLDITPDGTKLLFASAERLTGDDTDGVRDAYLLSGSSLTRVSAGPSGGNSNDPAHAHSHHDAEFLTDDGRRIALRSNERLTADDMDSQRDGYLWQDGEVKRVTHGPSGGNADIVGPPEQLRYASTNLMRAAHDGSTLLFSTFESLTPDDTDGYRKDLYEWRAGEVSRVTTGPNGGNTEYETDCHPDGGHRCGGGFELVSIDGSRVFFTAREPLVPQDGDDLVDVYQRAGGVTTLLSPPRAGRVADHPVWIEDASDDGSVVLLRTDEQLTPDDTDEAPDFFRVRTPAPGVVVPGAGGPDPGAPGGSGLQGGAALPDAARPGALLRLLNRPRRLRLARGRTRVMRRGHGLRFELPHRARVTVVLRRLRPGRRAVQVARLRLTLPIGRSTIVLGQRLGKRRKLAPGRYRIVVGADGASHVDLRVRLLAPR